MTTRLTPAHPETGVTLMTTPDAPSVPPAATCRTCATPIGYVDCPTGSWWAHDQHPADGHDAVPAAWVDGDPLMEAIAAAIWEHCETDGLSLVIDDPRNIAATAAAVARASSSAPVDRAAVLREAAEVAESFDIDASPQAVAAELRRLAGEARDERETQPVQPKRPPMDPVHILGIGAPAAVAQQSKEADGNRIVAYQSPGGTALFCTRHRDELSPYWPPVFSEDLPDGGICAHSTCGADLLIPQQPEAAEGAQQ